MKRCARKTGLLLLSVALLLVFGLTGCLVPIDEVEVIPAELVPIDEIDVMTPTELVTNVVEATLGVETFQYEMRTTTHMSVVTNIDVERFEVTITSTSIGVIDLLNERMRMATTTEFPIPEKARVPEDPEYMEMVVVTYFVDGMMYTKVSIPEMPAFWTKTEMPWGVHPIPVDQLVQLLKASEVELQGTEVVRGIDSFVISVAPNKKTLFLKIMAQQRRVVNPEIMEEIIEGIEDIEDLFRDTTITQWICRDTFLPLRERTQVTMTDVEVTKTMDSTTYYHSFNEPVSIVLPAEAADAVEMPMP